MIPVSVDLASHTIPAPQPRPLPWTVRVIRLVSDVGALAAVAALIYGVVTNVFALIAMGAILLICTLSSFYLIHQIADLKSIEEDTQDLQTLDASLAAKDARIHQLVSDIDQMTQKFNTQEKAFAELIQKDAALQKKLISQMDSSAALLAESEKDAQAALEKNNLKLTAQITSWQHQSEIDQKNIQDLKLTVSQANCQVFELKTALIDLQKQIATYQQQNNDYAKSNLDLQKQIQKLSTQPEIDSTQINAHAKAIEKAAAEQKDLLEKNAALAARVSSIMEAMSHRLPAKK